MKFVHYIEQIVIAVMSYKRPVFQKILERLREPRKTIQVLAGPRQVGKTTLVKQLLKAIHMPFHYVSADIPTLQDTFWVTQQWEAARLLTREAPDGALLVLDEVQKIPQWSTSIKKLWDEDTFNEVPLKVVLLGSSPLLIRQGLTESLAGRFELIPITHWSFQEMHEAFDWNVDQFIYFGGYPGAAEFIQDEERWKDYILHSLIETTISRDILLMVRVDKPALLRRLFHLGCNYSGQILSYQKMLGQLHDAGNATTLAHYLELLTGAGMLMGIPKYSIKDTRQKASSPKLQVLNTALISAQSQIHFNEAKKNRNYWGRLVESAVGAHLVNQCYEKHCNVYYWRERNKEVDFILSRHKQIMAIEVKSGLKKTTLLGMDEFSKKYDLHTALLVGADGIPLERFFKAPLEDWFTN
ncbi:ATP-binding protein [Coxiella burnetii]|uniref:ATP-binding protein n=1 Tax=Coxiella burnetii TaxID=777 RepID=UPI00222FADCB|nr:ATP-binding protein [Coxiella burnetii]